VKFVFLDLESTGLDRCFDQIIHLAAVCTDEDLNESENFDIRCRLLPHIVPSITAMRVNRITVQQLTDSTFPSHYEMMSRIREKLLSWSPAVFIGYNSVHFDEHFLRQGFYQSLYPPYVTNTGGNWRSDALRLVQASTIFAPQALQFPVWESGELTYRLDRLAPVNGFDPEAVHHDAMTDVHAMLHVCRILRTAAPDFWSSAIRLSRKPAILDFIATSSLFGLVEFFFAKPYAWAVAPLGHSDDLNGICVFNLGGVAPERLEGLSEPSLQKRLAQRPKPVRRIRANAVPILCDIESAPPFTEGLDLGSTVLQGRADYLRSNSPLRARLVAAFDANREQPEPSSHVEEQLYSGGFFGNADHRLLSDFHRAPWEQRVPLLERIQDGRLRELGQRLAHCERPDLLDQETRRAHDARVVRKLLGIDGDVPWLTLPKAIQQADELLGRIDGPDRDLITEHRDYLRMRMSHSERLVGRGSR
jgi:exodeoxyribonuclease-1